MALLKNGQFVKDLWRTLEDGEDPVTVEYPLISLGTWVPMLFGALLMFWDFGGDG